MASRRVTESLSSSSYEPEFTRMLPNSEDAERALISSFLQSSHKVGAMLADRTFTDRHFYNPAFAELFSLLMEFYRDNEPVDFITITSVLSDRGKLARIGGPAFITETFTWIPTSANAAHYADIVEDKWKLREVIEICTNTVTQAYNQQEDVGGVLTGLESAMLTLVKMRTGKRIHARSMAELVQRAADRIQAALDGDGSIDMPSGIPELDFYTMGFRAPELTVIAGKSSDGKSALAFNIAEEMALRRGKKVGIISLEMSADQLADRLLSAVSEVNIRAVKRDRSITNSESARIVEAAKKLADAPIFIRDDGRLSVSEIDAQFAVWKAEHGLDFGIIDHAQLATIGGPYSGKTEEVEQVSRAMKPMAKKFEIPIILLSQVTISGTGDQQTYSTKNAKALQEDSDNLFTISHTDKGSFINISKQRDGERNVNVPVIWNPEIQRFSGIPREPKADQPELLPPAAKTRK